MSRLWSPAFLASISLLLVSKSDFLVSISLLLVSKSDLLVSISLLLVSKSDFLASILLLLMSKSDFLASILLLLVSKAISSRAFRFSSSAKEISLLFGAVNEIVEQRHAVGFGPNTYFAGFRECSVVPLDCFLTVEGHCEVIALEIHS